jgi:hypothetical protein
MAFVIEKIESAKQRAEFESLRLISPITRQPAKLGRWVVDRERGLYFVNFGGGAAEMPYLLALAEQGSVVLQAEGREQSKGPIVPNGVDVSWNVQSITIAKSEASRADQLLKALRDALLAYGSLGNPDVVKSVRINMTDPSFD